MEITKTPNLSKAQLNEVFELWNTEFPTGLIHKSIEDFEAFLKPLGHKTHYIITEKDLLLGWALAFNRDTERWFSVLVNRTKHRAGLGKLLIQTIQADNQTLNGWVVDHANDQKADGSPYPSPIEFYKKLGFKVIPEIRLEKPGLSCVKVRWNYNYHQLSDF